MLSLSEDNQSDVIEAFNSTSRYLDDLLNIDNNFFDSIHIYHSELQLNKANVSDIKASFLDLYLSISDGFVKTKTLCFGSLVVLDVVFRYLSLCLINTVYAVIFAGSNFRGFG